MNDTEAADGDGGMFESGAGLVRILAGVCGCCEESGAELGAPEEAADGRPVVFYCLHILDGNRAILLVHLVDRVGLYGEVWRLGSRRRGARRRATKSV